MKRSITTAFVSSLFLVTTIHAGGAQTPPFPINSYTGDGQSFPAVCADPAGNFVVVWESGSPESGPDGSFFGIFGRRFMAGGAPRASDFAVNTYTTDYQTFPAIGCGNDGRFVVTWSSFGQDGASTGVFGQRFDSGGAPAGTEFQINTHTTGAQDYPTLDVAGDGDFVVVWTSDIQDGSGLGVFGQRFSSSGEKTGIEFRANSYTSGDQSYPAISVSNAGTFVVTWASTGQDGNGNGVFAQRFSVTALEIGSEFRVNSTTLGAQGYPAIAMNDAEGFTIVWSSNGQDGSDSGIIARRFASDGNPIGGEIQVNTYTTGAQRFPRISAANTGEFVIVWTSYGQDGDDAGVFGQRFASDGQRAGTEFQVNQSVVGAQYSPAAAAVSRDDFVIVWATHDGDPSGTDVVGRWYAPTPTSTATRPPTATHTPTSTRTRTPTSPPAPSVTATQPGPTATVAPPTATATRAPTDVPTNSPTATAVDTATDTPTLEPTATPTDVDTPTLVPPSATPSPAITGDCNHDGLVTVSELVTGVNVALERVDVSRCEAIDVNHDGRVNINELVAAVRETLAA